MARTFTSASSEKITLSLGAGGSITGAVTLAAIVKRATNGVNHGLVSIGSATATQRSLILSSANVVTLRSGNALQSGTTTVQIADGWCFVCATKAAGTATPRFHIYKYAAATWAHENAVGTLTDSTPATNSLLGAGTGVAAFLNGDLAAAGAWASDTTDAQVESMAYDLNAWWQVAPNGLWMLDQSATTQKVLDLTGGGANESALTGTTVGTSSVPVFSYGHRIVFERGVAFFGTGAKGTIANTGRAAMAETLQASGRGAIAVGGWASLTGTQVRLSGSGAIAVGGRAFEATTLALTGKGAISTAGVATVAETLVLSGKGAISAAGRAGMPLTLQSAAKGTIATTGRAAMPLTIGAAGTGAIATTGAISSALTLGMSGRGAVSTAGNAGMTVIGQVAFSGSGAISTAGRISLALTASLAGKGTISTAGNARLTVTSEIVIDVCALLDEDGQPILDENGEQILEEQCGVVTELPVGAQHGRRPTPPPLRLARRKRYLYFLSYTCSLVAQGSLDSPLTGRHACAWSIARTRHAPICTRGRARALARASRPVPCVTTIRGFAASRPVDSTIVTARLGILIADLPRRR